MSLSAGPIGGTIALAALISWNELLRRLGSRWKILIGLLLCLFVGIQSVANRSALTVMTSLFVFDPASYWYRRVIWQYGTENVANHPIFGLGMNEWVRPVWMPPTIDNFWLVQAVHWGLPAPIFLMLAFSLIVIAVALKKDLDERLVEYRTGFVLAMVFFFLVGWSVAFWGSTYVVFLFLLGSGVWILDSQVTWSGAKNQPGLIEASKFQGLNRRTTDRKPTESLASPGYPRQPRDRSTPGGGGWSSRTKKTEVTK